jgi:hypothetical protein
MLAIIRQVCIIAPPCATPISAAALDQYFRNLIILKSLPPFSSASIGVASKQLAVVG